MVEIMKMLGDYLTENTALTHDIQPSVAVPEEPHISIIPGEMDIQILKSFAGETRDSIKIIGLDLDIKLTGTGSDLAWLDTVFEASLKMNGLFSEYFNVTLGTSGMGFSVAVEKKQKGKFSQNAQGTYPFTFTEVWKAQIVYKRGGINHGAKKTGA